MTHMGKVNDVYSNGQFSVHLAAGYDVNARNTTGLKILMDDTVRCEQRSAGIWEIVDRITVHPDPVIPDPPAPPAKPSVSVSVPGAPSGSGASLPATSELLPSNATLSEVIGWCRVAFGILGTHRANVNAINNSLSSLQSVVNGLRTGLGQAGAGLGATISYAESTGGAALEAAGDIADATVEAGTTARLPKFTIDSVKAPNVAGFASESPDAVNAMSLWLDHRIQWTKTIHSRLNSARAHFTLTPCPSIGDTPWDLVSVGSWGARASRIQDADDWFMNAMNLMKPMIDGVRGPAGLPTFSWPTGLQYAWANRGTFVSSKDGLATSLQAHHTAYTAGMGTALVQVIRKVNGG